MNHWHRLWLCGLAAMLPLTGCSRAPTLGQVTGTVTYKGQPLKDGAITFVPADGRSATGKIVDGKIMEVTSYETGDGAPVGSHKVAIQSGTGGEDMYAPVKSLIPDKYSNPELSGLTADIVSGDNNLTFDLNN